MSILRARVAVDSLSWRVAEGSGGKLELSDPRRSRSLADAPLPAGAYTTLRSYGQTGLLLLDGHIDRLEESARLLGHPRHLDRAGLRRLLCGLLRERRWVQTSESRLRLTLDCAERPGELWISIEPLPLPSPTERAEGVAVLVRPMQRENPLAKDNAFIELSRETRRLIGGRINEVLMVGPEGMILEGLSSNFFGVRAGTLLTAEAGILPGLTRSLILEMAGQAAIPVRLEPVTLEMLRALDEAFLSSTTRGVLPVVEIDGLPVGAGTPGPVTQALSARYEARLAEEVEWVCEETA